jgi:hypothetical protein
MSSAFQYKNNKLCIRIQLLLSKEVSQPPESSYFYHFDCVKFIVKCINLMIVPCSADTIIVNRTSTVNMQVPSMSILAASPLIFMQ